MEMTNAERREMKKHYDKLVLLIELVKSYKSDVKALRTVLRLIKGQVAALKKSKSPVAERYMRDLIWQYDDFVEITIGLIKAKSVEAVARADSEFSAFSQKVKNIAEEYKDKEVKEGGAKVFDKISSGLESTVQKISHSLEVGAGKLGESVSGAVEEIKKKFRKGEDGEKSE